jgi:hypothetical protein
MMRLFGVVVIGISIPALGAPTPGKVVRVERERAFPLVIPVLCVNVQDDGSAMCIGPQPKAGEVITVIDETKVLAEVRVDGSKRYTPKCDSMWTVTGSVINGTVDPRNRKSLGLIDANISNTAARMVPRDKLPSPQADIRVELGIDRDGDGTADVLAAGGNCGGARNECVEFWTRRRKGLERVWTANLQTCQ